MQNIKQSITRFVGRAQSALKGDEGQGTVEYILVTGVIAIGVVIAAATGGLGAVVTASISKVSAAIAGA